MEPHEYAGYAAEFMVFDKLEISGTMSSIAQCRNLATCACEAIIALIFDTKGMHSSYWSFGLMISSLQQITKPRLTVRKQN
jgi:hypothetical protein